MAEELGVCACRTPTHIYLVRLTKENDYALIDAGCAEKPLVADILAAVREATKDGKLRLLLRAPPCYPLHDPVLHGLHACSRSLHARRAVCPSQTPHATVMRCLNMQDFCVLNAVTHGHVDHVGATPELAAAYPDMQVVMHVDELPYVLGRQLSNLLWHI